MRGWAAGHLSKDKRLATSGPYAHTRNPLYLGTLLVAAGLAAASRSWLLAGLFAAVFGLIYLPAIELEEQHLRQLFPEYAGYAETAPRLGWRGRRPLASARGSVTPCRFQFLLYKRNREYQALAGYLAGVAWLIWKAMR